MAQCISGKLWAPNPGGTASSDWQELCGVAPAHGVEAGNRYCVAYVDIEYVEIETVSQQQKKRAEPHLQRSGP